MRPANVKVEADRHRVHLRAMFSVSTGVQGKEKLLTDLRKELNITNDQHAQFLGKVMEDEVVLHVREKGANAKVSKDLRKKVEGSRPSFVIGGGSSASKKLKKEKTKSLNSLGASSQKKTGTGARIDEYVGKKVKRWWQDEGAWFDGIVTDYKPEQGHCIVYDFNTENESFEWYDIRKATPDECVITDGTPVGKQAPSAAPAFAGTTAAATTVYTAKIASCTTTEELERLKEEIRSKEEKLRRELDALSDSESDMSEDGAL